MNEIEQLQYFSLCSKVSSDIFSHIGMKDKVLTEYVIDQALEAKDEDDFINKMNDDGSGFSLQFCVSLYSSVYRMLPDSYIFKKKQRDFRPDEFKAGDARAQRSTDNRLFPGGPEFIPNDLPKDVLAKRFPALALANNDEEIKLDLDDIQQPPEEQPEPVEADNFKDNRVKRKDSLSSDSKSVPAKKRKDSKRKRRDNSSRSSSSESSKSRSRSRSKHTKHTKTKTRSSSESSRSRSRRRDKKKKRTNRSRDSSKKTKRRRSEDMPSIGKIYPGYVTMKLREGLLVQLSDWKVDSRDCRTVWKAWCT